MIPLRGPTSPSNKLRRPGGPPPWPRPRGARAAPVVPRSGGRSAPLPVARPFRSWPLGGWFGPFALRSLFGRRCFRGGGRGPPPPQGRAPGSWDTPQNKHFVGYLLHQGEPRAHFGALVQVFSGFFPGSQLTMIAPGYRIIGARVREHPADSPAASRNYIAYTRRGVVPAPVIRAHKAFPPSVPALGGFSVRWPHSS